MKRAFSKDASILERATAMTVSAAMKAKRKIGGGLKKKKIPRITFNKLIQNARKALKSSKPENIESAAIVAIKSINKSIKGKKIKPPRVIKVPTYRGGVLPLVPIFAGLSALGSIVGGATSVVKAIKDYRNNQKELEESKRHNSTMEAIAIGKGYYLKPYKNGFGFFLKPQKNY